MFTKSPVEVDHPFVLGGFKKLIADKADQVVPYRLEFIGLSDSNNY